MEVESRLIPAGAEHGSSLFILESCHSVWLFDPDRSRFRRVLKGLELAPSHASTGWRAYESLDIDEVTGRFVVVLNKAGNRLIRSRRHGDSCPDCRGDEVTVELTRDDIQLLVGA